MKKNWFYMFLLMAVAVLPLTSCDKEEEPQTQPEQESQQQHDPKADDDQTPITDYDALEWLQGSLVVVNGSNTVVRRIYGEPLDLSMPDILSIPVKDYASAEKIFLGWVAPGKEAIMVEGGYDYFLTDEKGREQGSVSLRAIEGEAGVIARMSVAEGTDLKQVREVNFIDYNYWPENAEYSIYEAGKTYWIKADEMYWDYSQDNNGPTNLVVNEKDLEFYCIQGNGDGNEAILVWLSTEAGFTGWDWLYKSKAPVPASYIDDKAYIRLSSVAEAQKVLDFCNANPNAWYAMLTEMDSKGYSWKANTNSIYSTGNAEFLLNSYDEEDNSIKCLDLDFVEDYVDDGYEGRKGEICNVWKKSLYHYRYIHIRTFPAAK